YLPARTARPHPLIYSDRSTAFHQPSARTKATFSGDPETTPGRASSSWASTERRLRVSSAPSNLLARSATPTPCPTSTSRSTTAASRRFPCSSCGQESKTGPDRRLHRRTCFFLRKRGLKLVLLVADGAAAVVFLATPEQDGQHCDGYEFEAGDGPLVADEVAQGILNRVCRRGQQNSELIGKAGHQAASGIRGHLVQVHGDHTPSALHPCLYQESREDDEREGLPEGPQRSHQKHQAQSSQHAFAPAGHLGELAEDDSADDRSAVVNNGHVGAHGGGKFVHFLEKVRIQVLRAVGEKHHEGHQGDEIREALPFPGHDAENLASAGGSVLPPGFGLRHFGADVEREKRGNRAGPKHSPPPEGRQQESRSH